MIDGPGLEGIEAVVAELEARVEIFTGVLMEEFAKADTEFKEVFKTDVSGRAGNNTGLNVISGNLRDSIKTAEEKMDGMVLGRVFNEGADYWEYSQTGVIMTRTSAWGKPTRPYIWSLPKRLDWLELFDSEAAERYGMAVETALMGVAA